MINLWLYCSGWTDVLLGDTVTGVVPVGLMYYWGDTVTGAVLVGLMYHWCDTITGTGSGWTDVSLGVIQL